MLQLTFVFVGVLALVGTLGAVETGLDHETRAISAAFSMAAWAYWAVSALSVDAVASDGSIVSETYLGLLALGAAAAAIMLLVLTKLALETPSDGADREVLDPHA